MSHKVGSGSSPSSHARTGQAQDQQMQTRAPDLDAQKLKHWEKKNLDQLTPKQQKHFLELAKTDPNKAIHFGEKALKKDHPDNYITSVTPGPIDITGQGSGATSGSGSIPVAPLPTVSVGRLSSLGPAGMAAALNAAVSKGSDE